ncbi:MAG: hypothetical protein CMK36_00240 [Porticoccaceae bacterium]|nr:hypothetical protein [Porticoccaceae bacterium]
MQTGKDLYACGYPDDFDHVDKTGVHKIARYFANKWVCYDHNYWIYNDGCMEVLPRILEAAS